MWSTPRRPPAFFPSQASRPYCAAKHAVTALTEVLDQDLRKAGSSIGVSLLCPGPVASEIAHAARNRPGWEPRPGDAEALHTSATTLAAGLHPDRVGDLVFDAIRDGRFYVFTDEWTKQRGQRRADAIVSDIAPNRWGHIHPPAAGAPWPTEAARQENLSQSTCRRGYRRRLDDRNRFDGSKRVAQIPATPGAGAHRHRIALAVLDQIIHIQPLARVSAGSCDLGVPSLSLANALALRLQMVGEPGPSGGR